MIAPPLSILPHVGRYVGFALGLPVSVRYRPVGGVLRGTAGLQVPGGVLG